jgi:hypothetical protein
MKTKLSLSILMFTALCSLAVSQVPQGFNYQAVARLTTGDPIINTTLPVRITIQADSLGSIIIWQELHSSVTTNGFGLMTLILGKGARQIPSTVPTFSAIDWSVTPKFIKTEIDYSGWKTMGVTRLWSVPYSSIAEGLGGPVKKLAVKGVTALPDEALFEVKNKDGQTVFAVYNEGVRVYVSDGAKALKGGFAVGGFGTDKAVSTPYFVVGKDSVRVYLDTNPLTKKLKGGFAVGGYDLTKGTVQDYLDVSSDSVRIYIDSNPATKKLKGGFAVGGYDIVKGTSTNYMNVNPDTTNIIYPSQNKIYWYPLKNAFLTGKVLIEKPDSVGTNSFASGYESKAKGKWSQALGYKAIARGDYSTAIGKNAIANKINSFAFGEDAAALKDESYAFGRGAVASGYRSFAFGSAGRTEGGNPTGVASAYGNFSFAIGAGSKTYEESSYAIGLETVAQGYHAFAIGNSSIASGQFSTAVGHATKATGNESLSIGSSNESSGSLSSAIGWQNRSIGFTSLAVGSMNSAESNCSIACGYNNKSKGDHSAAFGIDNQVNSGSYAFGNANVTTGSSSIALGVLNKTDGLFAVAIGFSSKALVASTAIGFQTIASGSGSTSIGVQNNSKGDYSCAMGISTIAKAKYSFVSGCYNDTTCSVNGSTQWVSTDPIFICGNGTADSDRKNALTILKNGQTAIGHSAPTQTLDVNGNARFRSVGSGTFAYNLNLTTDGTLTTATSDISMKENINQITDALDIVNRLRGVTFTWKNDTAKTRQIGMIAQEVEPVVPEIVFTNPVDGLKGINYSQATALLVEAIKEQQQQIESYKSQLQILQEKIDRIEAMLAKGGGY